MIVGFPVSGKERGHSPRQFEWHNSPIAQLSTVGGSAHMASPSIPMYPYDSAVLKHYRHETDKSIIARVPMEFKKQL
jgi:hypothetical protein